MGIRGIKTTLLCIGLGLGSLNSAMADTGKSAASLDELLRQVKASQGEEGRRNKAREQRFLAEKSQQQTLLKQAEAELVRTQAESDRLKSLFESNEEKLAELTEILHQRTGTLGEVFGVVRQSAGDLKAVISDSLVSAQHTGRVPPIENLANSRALPTVSELETLWYTLQQEMTESGKVVTFNADVIGVDGVSLQRPVTRIGTFTAVSDGKYLNYLAETGQLITLSRQPGQPHSSLAQDIGQLSAGVGPMTIDPTRGSILGMLVQSPSALERVQQGGVIGYIILALGLLGILVGAERFWRLSRIGSKIRQQLEAPDKPQENNPLGRVLQVFDSNSSEDLETLELRLDEAILKETPALSRGVRIVKLLAAIAPLLGLLGTVTGMIGTFQAITLFGTGDPKLMAGGISQALVTTMLGLIVAVPLLFMHAGIAARSQRFIQILDEQSAGLIARQLENKR